MQTLQIHPKFSKALRDLMPDEIERLDASIQAEGCHTPIQTWKGFIIDGHNRYGICHASGQSFKVTDRTDDFETETDVLMFIFDNALAGRNLDFADKKDYIGELYNLTKQKNEDKVKRLSDKTVTQGDTSINIGSKFGVSSRTVKRYGSEVERKKLIEQLQADIRKEANERGKPDDEEWMMDRYSELSESIQPEDDETFDTGVDEFNQGEPTDEQIEAKKAAAPKRSKLKSKSYDSQRKAALRGYAAALDKIQALRLDLLFDNSLELPVFANLFASIKKAEDALPKPKARFGR